MWNGCKQQEKIENSNEVVLAREMCELLRLVQNIMNKLQNLHTIHQGSIMTDEIQSRCKSDSHEKRNHLSDSHGNDQGSKVISWWTHLLIEKPAQWVEIVRKKKKSRLIECIEIKTENNAENIIMLLYKSAMHPHSVHGIQF